MPDLSVKAVFAAPGSGFAEGLIATERTGIGIATVMVRKGKLAELASALNDCFGLDLPSGPKWTSRNEVTFLGTGPGRWLAISDKDGAAFPRLLETKLPDASVVEQTGGLGVLRLTGNALLKTLEKGVQIDLAESAFPVGSVAVTSIAHVGVTLWKLDDTPAFDIAVARSSAGSLQYWLAASAASAANSSSN